MTSTNATAEEEAVFGCRGSGRNVVGVDEEGPSQSQAQAPSQPAAPSPLLDLVARHRDTAVFRDHGLSCFEGGDVLNLMRVEEIGGPGALDLGKSHCAQCGSPLKLLAETSLPSVPSSQPDEGGRRPMATAATKRVLICTNCPLRAVAQKCAKCRTPYSW